MAASIAPSEIRVDLKDVSDSLASRFHGDPRLLCRDYRRSTKLIFESFTNVGIAAQATDEHDLLQKSWSDRWCFRWYKREGLYLQLSLVSDISIHLDEIINLEFDFFDNCVDNLFETLSDYVSMPSQTLLSNHEVSRVEFVRFSKLFFARPCRNCNTSHTLGY